MNFQGQHSEFELENESHNQRAKQRKQIGVYGAAMVGEGRH